MVLNNKQRIILIIGVLLFALMGLFPPWINTLYGEIHQVLPAGYAFIASPPNPKFLDGGVSLDISRLVVQWFILIVVTGFGLVVTKTERK